MKKINSCEQKMFSQLVLNWFDQNGRKDLPWQENKIPYRVWVSEIMLQQTQVSTVIPYFKKFTQHFPDVHSLAEADEDAVLHLWTGLGYYSRARNLHYTAKIVKKNFAGNFPDESAELEKLPGIGRSTAGAILSIAFQKPAAILDGNVKRVLTRYHGITEWPGERKTHDQLWLLAEKHTPKIRVADYSQAMMDLGATICIRGKPHCGKCPLAASCVALEKDIAKTLPKSKPKKILPVRQTTLLFIQQNHAIFLEKRPPTGIWGGLWSPPQLSGHASPEEIAIFCRQHFSFQSDDIQISEPFRHTFSHFHLDILPIRIKIESVKKKVMEASQQIWFNLKNPQEIGLPAPIKKLLKTL